MMSFIRTAVLIAIVVGFCAPAIMAGKMPNKAAPANNKAIKETAGKDGGTNAVEKEGGKGIQIGDKANPWADPAKEFILTGCYTNTGPKADSFNLRYLSKRVSRRAILAHPTLETQPMASKAKKSRQHECDFL